MYLREVFSAHPMYHKYCRTIMMSDGFCGRKNTIHLCPYLLRLVLPLRSNGSFRTTHDVSRETVAHIGLSMLSVSAARRPALKLPRVSCAFFSLQFNEHQVPINPYPFHRGYPFSAQIFRHTYLWDTDWIFGNQ